jgi:hypothetical protein
MPKPTLFNVSFPLTEQTARDIIGEASSNYWLDDYGPKWDRAACRLTLKKRVGDGQSTEPAKTLTVTHVNIARALSLALAGRANRLPDDNCRSVGAEIIKGIAGPGDGCGADGIAKDALLQIAIFGAVVYS